MSAGRPPAAPAVAGGSTGAALGGRVVLVGSGRPPAVPAVAGGGTGAALVVEWLQCVTRAVAPGARCRSQRHGSVFRTQRAESGS